jgi:hypothetical protein
MKFQFWNTDVFNEKYTPNLDISIILCGKMVFVLQKFYFSGKH